MFPLHVLAIDPGDTESGYAFIDAATCRPIEAGKISNEVLADRLRGGALEADLVAIEMVASYGMPVGREVFETCVWIGRYQEILTETDIDTELVVRARVKMHFCNSTAARDSNVTHALVDRFTPGAKNFGKGTKDAPGWFYGFHNDIWQAYALAVYKADLNAGRDGLLMGA